MLGSASDVLGSSSVQVMVYQAGLYYFLFAIVTKSICITDCFQQLTTLWNS